MLKREVARLELRNLQLLEEMQQEQLQGLEISVYVVHYYIAHVTSLKQHSGTSSLIAISIWQLSILTSSLIAISICVCGSSLF